MRLEVDGRIVFASSGGKPHEPGQPLIVFVHGAGMDHSVWALQSRWIAHHGRNVLAVDLPGHGGSDGPPLLDIGALADWTARLIAAAGAPRAALVGHSMGALIAIETAARHERVASLTLIGVAGKMPVHPDLLDAAAAYSRDAIAMVSLWSLGAAATRGGNPAPGLWMLGETERLLERAAPGVLHADLAACDNYSGAVAAAARVRCPTTLILGERDQMTPPKMGRALALEIAGAKTIVLAGAGHMPMLERPDEILDALKEALPAAS
jgi:pimeloyl-ACP methyl ester carboxylesterase